MKLDKMQQTASGGQLLLIFSDETRLKAPTFVAADFGLFPGKELTDDEMQALRAAVSKARTRERAVRSIAASALSEKELSKRLVQKGASETDAQETVDWLRELRLLDDAETARQLAQSAAAKGYGASRIRSILYEKGIPREFWDEAMTDLPQSDGAIDKFLHQRLDGRALDDKMIKKTVDALLRRGHSWRDIDAGLRRYREGLSFSAEGLEEME